ncbi:MAG: 16S rRNA (uracil(1498)-N(3))-methyltransferase [Thermoleophilia bacterium]|nr:16S rRNA (uracil(1498)-N(3))-methyltransferase [Thermoleophilia bacterium]
MPGFRPRFFVPLDSVGSEDRRGLELPLTAEDSHHALRVLRLCEGDECEVVVGAVRAAGVKGTMGAAVYAATVSATADPVRVRLDTLLDGVGEGPEYRVEVGLAQALTRPPLIDQVVEKGTEVGASSFLLVHAAGSPARPGLARPDRLERWRRIAREAAKQSKRAAVPVVDATDSLAEALEHPMVAGSLSLVLEPGAPRTLKQALLEQGDADASPCDASARVMLWVGTEGGWSPAELESFSVAGMDTVRLGKSVLRTETAGPVAVAVARLTLGDW